jgi:hypothetical protein
MKVWQVIEKLSKKDPELDVRFQYDIGDYIGTQLAVMVDEIIVEEGYSMTKQGTTGHTIGHREFPDDEETELYVLLS